MSNDELYETELVKKLFKSAGFIYINYPKKIISMVKTDKSLQMQIKQFLVMGRPLPTESNPSPNAFAMRVFAPNVIVAKTKFWSPSLLIQEEHEFQEQIQEIQW